MSNHCIPPEICDHIVDFLRDNPDTLKRCCLVSKSWVSRTRKHLFAAVKFNTPADLQAWRRTFQDPSNSPAQHTHTLSIGFLEVIAEGGWVPSFSRVVRFKVFGNANLDLSMDLTPFRKFSPTLKSLHVTSFSIQPSQVIDLIYHLPLLEDLALFGYDRGHDGSQTVGSPSTSPVLTGTLNLRLVGGVARTVHQLLNLPNGLHLRKLELLSFGVGALPFVWKLVEACSETLEYLDVQYEPEGAIFSCSASEPVIN